MNWSVVLWARYQRRRYEWLNEWATMQLSITSLMWKLKTWIKQTLRNEIARREEKCFSAHFFQPGNDNGDHGVEACNHDVIREWKQWEKIVQWRTKYEWSLTTREWSKIGNVTRNFEIWTILPKYYQWQKRWTKRFLFFCGRQSLRAGYSLWLNVKLNTDCNGPIVETIRILSKPTHWKKHLDMES